ncbi:30S ribosomal protein S4e, partial [Candidatus Aenigmatarchaeota archaeon]
MTLKRLAAPRFWPIERKNKKYIISPKPGPFAKEDSIPLG